MVPEGVSGWTPLYLLTKEVVYLLWLQARQVGTKGDFIHQYYTDNVPGPQKPLGVGALRACECRLALVSGMRRRDERVCAVLKYFDGKTFSEAIGCCVQVKEHRVAPKPPH